MEDQAADLRVADGVAALSGPWTLPQLSKLDDRLRDAPLDAADRIDARGLTRLDTAGAMVLLRALRRAGGPPDLGRIEGMRPEARALLELVASRLDAAAPPREPH